MSGGSTVNDTYQSLIELISDKIRKIQPGFSILVSISYRVNF